jgi:hypothetical protein
VDRNSACRRSCSVVLTEGVAWDANGNNYPVVATTPQSAFLPYGAEFVLYQGIQYSTGTQELIQLGVFGIEDVQIDDTEPDIVVTFTGYDRAKAISRAGFVDTFAVAASIPIATAIQNLFASLPLGFQLFYSLTSTQCLTPSAPSLYQPGDDPWDCATQLAESDGCALYFDATGTCVLMPTPNPNSQPIQWSYDEGPTNLATELKRLVSRQNAPNYIVRIGSGSGVSTPVQATAFDNDPTSPTYVGGSYGRQVNSGNSPLISTQTQAQNAANADLLTALGGVESIDLTGIPRPDADVDDVVEITRIRAGLTLTHYVVDSYTLGFGTAGLLEFIGRNIDFIPTTLQVSSQ